MNVFKRFPGISAHPSISPPAFPLPKKTVSLHPFRAAVISICLVLLGSPGTVAGRIKVYEPAQSGSTARADKKGRTGNIKTYQKNNNKSKPKAGPAARTVKAGKGVFDFIIIDAGHGGRDGGAIGYGRYLEKSMTLKVSKAVARAVKRRIPGLKIYQTRTRDRYVSLSGRTRIANRKYKFADNGLFARNRRVHGYEIYYLSDSNKTEASRQLAAFENRHLIPSASSKEAMRMESAMLMAQIKAESWRLAGRIEHSMRRRVKAKSRGIKSANLHVLRGALMPAILLEVGFISNRREAGLLKNDAYIGKMAAAIADGIAAFVSRQTVQ
jgi:N-acetylmuramoyl-L-alanine amidase